MTTAPLSDPGSPHDLGPSPWRAITAGASASFVGIGLARFAYTPLLPSLIDAHWFTSSAVVYLGAANLAGYLIGALLARPIARRISDRSALRWMMALASIALLACAAPLSVGWFFAWRLASGLAGGTIMVLVAGTVLPHIPGQRRGLAGGAIFMGLGLGIAASGTIVPLLLRAGLSQTWAGLALLCAVLTAFSWNGWPRAAPAAAHAAQVSDQPALGARLRLDIVFGQYALLAVGLVPTMEFLVDFVTRGLGESTGVGSFFWILYGLGAIAGPASYGLLADRLGFGPALRIVVLVQAIAVGLISATDNAVAVGFLSVVIGTFPPGIVPVVLGRVHQVLPGRPQEQSAAWGRATTVFALFQALAGYTYSYVFAHSGEDHQLLFAIGAGALALALVTDLVARSARAEGPAENLAVAPAKDTTNAL